MHITIIPGKSIGALSLGARRAELPNEVTIEHGVGVLDGIHFSTHDEVIDEIWIDDLRTLPHEVTFNGQPVDRSASFTQLQQLFGPCSEVEHVLGGSRVTCSSGVQLGVSSVAPGESIQIRIRLGLR